MTEIFIPGDLPFASKAQARTETIWVRDINTQLIRQMSQMDMAMLYRMGSPTGMMISLRSIADRKQGQWISNYGGDWTLFLRKIRAIDCLMPERPFMVHIKANNSLHTIDGLDLGDVVETAEEIMRTYHEWTRNDWTGTDPI